MDRAVRRGVLLLVVTGLVAAVVGLLPTSAESAPAALDLSSSGGRAPQIAVDGAGNAIAAWYREAGGTATVQAATRPPGGAWTAPIDLSAPGPALTTQQTETPPLELAVNESGDAVAVWSRSDGSNVIVQASVRPAGGNWSTPADLSEEGEDALWARVALDDNGSATAVWSRSDGSNPIIQAATRAANGSWSMPEDLSVVGTTSRIPRVAADDAGNVTVIWSRIIPSIVVQAAVRPHGGGWAPAVDISAAGTGGLPDLAVGGAGRAVAVWMSFEGGEWVIRGSRRAAVDDDWSAVELVSTPQAQTTGSARVPDVAMNAAGEAVAAWFRTTNTSTLVEVTSSSFAGTWSAPVTTGAPSAERPQVVVDHVGRAAVAWMAWNGSNYIIQESFRPAGGVWTPAVDLSAAGGTASAQQIALTPTGWLEAIWIRFNGTTAFVQAVLVDPLAPPLPPTTTPTITPTITPPMPSQAPTPTSTPTPTTSAALAPVLGHAVLTKEKIHVATSDSQPRATRLKCSLNVAAKVLVRLTRTQKIKGKAVVARLSRSLAAGKWAIRLTSRVGATKLPPGLYRLTVVAKNTVGASAPEHVRLRILP